MGSVDLGGKHHDKKLEISTGQSLQLLFLKICQLEEKMESKHSKNIDHTVHALKMLMGFHLGRMIGLRNGKCDFFFGLLKVKRC